MTGSISPYRIGVTGTRNGMTLYQYSSVMEFLMDIIDLYPSATFSHGDCVGVDVEIAEIAKELGFKVICHPPIDDELRAYHESDEILEPLTCFARNRNIVNSTDILMVVPFQDEKVFLSSTRGGTKYTHDYAKKVGKPTVEFYPREASSESYDLGDF